jgi:hypothetical protein
MGHSAVLTVPSLLLKRLRQPGLAQDGISSVATGNIDGHRKISLRDRAVPDFVATAALADQRATGGAQQLA